MNCALLCVTPIYKFLLLQSFTVFPKTHHRAWHMVELPTAEVLQKLLQLLGNTAPDPPNSSSDVAADSNTLYLENKVMRGFMNQNQILASTPLFCLFFSSPVMCFSMLVPSWFLQKGSSPGQESNCIPEDYRNKKCTFYCSLLYLISERMLQVWRQGFHVRLCLF